MSIKQENFLKSKEFLSQLAIFARLQKKPRSAAQRIGKPVVVKSQILVAGRGKAGGIKLAQNPR